MVQLALQNRYDWKKVARKFLVLYKKQVTPFFLKMRNQELKAQDRLTKTQKMGVEEDKTMIKIIENEGLEWELMCNALPLQSEAQIKNRYYTKIKNKQYYKRVLDEMKAQDEI